MKGAKKIPIQVYLDPEQNKAIEALSRTTGKSKAAVVRSCISKFIENLPPEQDPGMNIMGLGASGKKDISQKHDIYLASTALARSAPRRQNLIATLSHVGESFRSV